MTELEVEHRTQTPRDITSFSGSCPGSGVSSLGGCWSPSSRCFFSFPKSVGWTWTPRTTVICRPLPQHRAFTPQSNDQVFWRLHQGFQFQGLSSLTHQPCHSGCECDHLPGHDAYNEQGNKGSQFTCIFKLFLGIYLSVLDSFVHRMMICV